MEEGALERARGLQAGEALRRPRAVAQHHVEVARLLLAQVSAHAVARVHPARAVGVPPQWQQRPQRPLRAGHRHACARMITVVHVCMRKQGFERVHPMHLRAKEPNRMRRDARPKGTARMPAGHACAPHAVVGTLAQRPAHRVEGRVV